tara:strand:+ start:325 stop:1095 length:771 start_codon:yes stop_codon:yes gene_type:complete
MNRIKELFKKKKKDILNVYFTAGYPKLDDTVRIATNLTHCGVDLIELGMPYSDPLADGFTIQQSSMKALKNGMSLDLLFDQVKEFRKSHETPIILMGYLNQVIQYGQEKFLDKCVQIGIDGLILPDLPMDIFQNEFKKDLEERDIAFSFLITPQTSDERILLADQLSTGFVYVVSQSSITGKTGDISTTQQAYFDHINKMNLSTPALIGFGIHDKSTYEVACSNSNGAIIGSAFIRALDGEKTINDKVKSFVHSIR